MPQSRRLPVLLTVAALVAALPATADSQGIGERMRQRAKEEAEKRMQKPAEAPAPAATPAAGTPAAAEGASGGGAAASAKPGEGAWANYDFVPGERVLFADDFSRDRVGDFPRRLELRDGTMEVVEWQGGRWLRVSSEGVFYVNLPETLPSRFTMEFDVTLSWNSMHVYGHAYESGNSTTHHAPHSVLELGGTAATLYRGQNRGESTMDPRSFIPGLADDYERSGMGRVVRVRVHGDGSYIKTYLNERRVANMPNADWARTNRIVFEVPGNNFNGEAVPMFIGNLTVNAGGGSLYDALSASGRVATQGILFDTGSDRIRPESTPTLKEITAMLREHPELKLTIEGHTDNVGQAAANQALSEKRAAAVQAYLVAQGVEAGRLQAKGLGDTKPKAGNDSAEGRQTNRRVELVKM